MFGALRNFKSFVKRYYRVSIYIYRSDNESVVVTLDKYYYLRELGYKVQVRKKDITLKYPLSETYKLNGRVERVGQEVISKLNAILLNTRLPKELQLEAAKAAAYLYNISPRKANHMHTPNEVLTKWFIA